jgi:hypothetical protein
MADANTNEGKQIYTSAQVAELLEVPPATLRTWKSRKSDQLQEGLHWFQENGQNFWTNEGVEVLIGIRDSVACKGDETPSVAPDETPSVAPDETPSVADPLQRYQSLVEAVAEAIAPQIVGRVDREIMQRVKTAIAKPMTSQECVAILVDFGLAPADPNALIGGASSVAGYLSPETPDN